MQLILGVVVFSLRNDNAWNNEWLKVQGEKKRNQLDSIFDYLMP